MMNLKPTFCAVALALTVGSQAQAGLILLSDAPFSGSGIGAVNTILTLTSPANSTVEAGCVAFGGTVGTSACFGDVATGGNELTGASQTQTRTVAQSGATMASNFAIVLNAQEPGGALNSIVLEDLSVRFYNPTGGLLYTATLNPATVPLNNTFTGTGNAGFVFVLDSGQAQGAQLAGAFSNPSNVIGLSARLSSATGGPETFFVGNLGTGGGGGVGTEIPEPMTYLTLGAGLMALGFSRKLFTHR
jgi:hypothetical protein